MTDNELLLAISNIVQTQVEPLKNEIQRVETSLRDEIQQVETSLRDEIQQVETSLRDEIQQVKTSLEDEVQQVKTSLGDEIKEIRLLLEFDVIPRLENIEDCYVFTFNKYSESFDKIETIQSDVNVLKKVVAEHSEKLQKIS